MEAASLLLNVSNTSAGNTSLLREFPYWQMTLALNLVSYFFVLAGIHLLVYLPLLVLLAKMKMSNAHLRPLNLIHMSLLASTIIEDILLMTIYTNYFPSMHRYCTCSDLLGTALGSILQFFTVYRPVIFACLGVLQLLVVFGKKRFLKIKVSCSVIAACIGVSLILPASFLRILYESNEKPICNTCFCPGYSPESTFSVVTRISVTALLLSMIPSLIVIMTTSIWSCTIFKTYYTGGDDQLNRRMLSLPIIMPLTILASTVLEVAIVMLVGRALLSLSLGEYFANWSVFTHLQLGVLLRLISRMIYPLILTYTHASLYREVKNLLKHLKINNRIHPDILATSTQTPSVS